MNRNALRCLVRAWLLTTAVDGVYATLLSALVYKATAGRIWQGVASTLLGPSALEGGARTVAVGLVMHAGVALLWSSVFLMLALSLPALRRTIATPGGVVAIAAVYGPMIWMMMSLVIIPRLTGRPPAITVRWWGNFFSHIPFVAIPIVATIGRGLAAAEQREPLPTVSAA